jgi:signal transduction histidine kinase
MLMPFRIPRSFHSLLHLEWLLLFVTAAIEVILYLFNPRQSASWSIVLIGLLFAAVGWWTGHDEIQTEREPKIIATAIEAMLIFVAGNLHGPQGLYFISVLCIIATIRACLRFRSIGQAIAIGSALVIFIAFLKLKVPPPQEPISEQLAMQILTFQIYSVLYFCLILIVTLLLVRVFLAEQKNRQELAIANQQLRNYALQIESQATLQERSRIAREIHDSLGHTLTAQSIVLQNTQVFFESAPNQAKEFLAEAIELGRRGLQDVRQSITALRQNPVQSKGLEGAIADLVEDFQQATGLQPIVEINVAQTVSPKIAIAIYRIVQEALTNIQKHSGASQAQINIRSTAREVVVTIADNGQGCDLTAPIAGFGWQGMRERTAELGGTLKITSPRRQGCQITAIFPLLS